MGIQKYIYDLLFDHECVIVPGFGGFIKNYKHAVLQDGTFVFNPPRQFVVFNGALSLNDGLLATHIAGCEKCSFDEAMSVIRRDVTSWHERLRSGKKVTLIDIGTFHHNYERKLVFEPDTDTNFFAEAYGLSAFVASPALKISGRKPLMPKPAASMSKQQLAALRNFGRAAAITIPLIAAGIWISMNTGIVEKYAQHSAGIIKEVLIRPQAQTEPINQTAAPEAKPTTSPENIYSFDVAEPIVPADSSQPALTSSGNIDIVKAMPGFESKPESGYHIIVGSFERKANAETLCRLFVDQGYRPVIVPNAAGMFRVSLTSFCEKNQALDFLYSLRKQTYPEAWVLRV